MAQKKNKQRQLQKKAAKRKQRRKKLARQRAALVMPSMSKAKNWPLHRVFVTDDWDDPMTLTQIIVVRKGPNNLYVLGAVLVDQACLGVKNAYGSVTDEDGYRMVYTQINEQQTLVPGDLNLVAKIIQESVTYAAEFGLRPNRDLPQALALMNDADPDACREDIPLGGPEGKPFFTVGPYDNVDAIITKLTNAVGPDGFNYLFEVGPPGFFDETDF